MILERVRAGLGAAGLIAVLAESISSMTVMPRIFGSYSNAFIASIAALAFAFASYVVDVPSSPEQDIDH